MEDVAGQSTAGSPPPSSIRTAVQEFVSTFTQASRELAGAGERFTREVLHVIQDERSRAEQAAVTSTEKAEQARQAADEVRATASGLHAAAQVLLEQARTTVHKSAEQASIDQVTRLTELGAQIEDRLRQRFDELMKQLDVSRDGYEAVQAGAQKATVTVQEALDRLEAAVRLIEAAEQKARLAAEAGTATAVHPVPNPGSGASALASGQEPLDSPGHAPSPGEKAVTRDPSVTGESGGLLGRLESGYTVVSSLLQDLQSRITNLGAVTLSGPESSSLPGAAGTLSGRVTLHISPVRDLDRLLALDNALGLMKGVANVTLADYVRDEAVFRLELHEAISAFDLAREFGRCAGISAEVAQASEGSVSLRIA